MEQNESVSDAPNDAGSADQEVVQQNPRGSETNESSDWHKRILSEKKALAQRVKEYEEKLQALQGKQLQAEGKKEEYMQHLEAQLKAEREKRLDDRATFAHRALSERIISEASRLGCVNPSDVLKLADLDKVSISDDLSIDETSVKLMMEDMKKQRPYLFRSQAIPTKDGSPVSKMEQVKEASQKPKAPDQMSKEEFDDWFRTKMKESL